MEHSPAFFSAGHRAAQTLYSARAAGCSVVFSEDMKHGQSYDGVVIENPFSR